MRLCEEKVKFIRDNKDLMTQVEISRALGCTQACVSRILNNHSHVTYDGDGERRMVRSGQIIGIVKGLHAEKISTTAISRVLVALYPKSKKISSTTILKIIKDKKNDWISPS